MYEILGSQPAQTSSRVVDVFAPVTAIIALLGTVGSFLYTARSTRLLALQQQKFQSEESDRNRSRELEKDFSNTYDALFRELSKASRRATLCIQDIAKWSKKGVLSQKPFRVGSPPFFEVVYSLTAPLAIHRIIARRAQNQMYALKAKPGAFARYEIAERLQAALLDDDILAELNPSLRRFQNIDQKSDRQRLLTEGLIEMQIIESRKDGELHHSYLSELLAPYDAGRLATHLLDAKRVLVGFTPEQSPLFWQLLIVQLHLHALIAYTTGGADPYEFPYESAAAALKGISIPEHERSKFDWRPHDSNVTDAAVLLEPFDAARQYLAQ